MKVSEKHPDDLSTLSGVFSAEKDKDSPEVTTEVLSLDSFEAEILKDVVSKLESLQEKLDPAQSLFKRLSGAKEDVDKKITSQGKHLKKLESNIRVCKRGKSGKARQQTFIRQQKDLKNLLSAFKKQSDKLKKELDEASDQLSKLSEEKASLLEEKSTLSGSI
ncbi:MAG: hypothetical protein K940chlam1_00046 [Candidatus Anoxychlamydiales bacterium]|nr:hypothetical protein [Candidatus Anoxychlamydiales bacterium]NGX35481.1 hypothetical protein [Candidatus Anoxychlamydiales bacterium]